MSKTRFTDSHKFSMPYQPACATDIRVRIKARLKELKAAADAKAEVEARADAELMQKVSNITKGKA